MAGQDQGVHTKEMDIFPGRGWNRAVCPQLRAAIHDLHLLWHSELPPRSQLHWMYFLHHTYSVSAHTSAANNTSPHTVADMNEGHLLANFKE